MAIKATPIVLALLSFAASPAALAQGQAPAEPLDCAWQPVAQPAGQEAEREVLQCAGEDCATCAAAINQFAEAGADAETPAQARRENPDMPDCLLDEGAWNCVSPW